MNCTKCKKGLLKPSFMDELFMAHTCNHCKGNWILIEDFVTWKESHQAFKFPAECDMQEDKTDDSKTALLCPITGTIMRKFRISANTDHRVDYSAAVGGIWLDNGEWELLKSEGIAGALNNLVTQQWQKQIREESAANNFAAIYLAKFGEDNYQKAKQIRAWLSDHPQKSDLRAYILAEDPYSAEK